MFRSVVRPRALLASVIVLFLGAGTLWISSSAQATAKVLSATDDAYAVQSHPNVNTGNYSMLLEGTSGDTRVIYLKFNVPASYKPGAGAKLRLWSQRNTNAPVEVHGVTTSTWKEANLNWANRPAVGAIVASAPGATAGAWLTLDVSTAVTKPGSYSFAILSPAGGTVNNIFSSSETAHAPGLTVDVSSPPSTSTTGTSTPSTTRPTTTTPPGGAKPVFVIYYLWWDRMHWVSHLGGAYPAAMNPNPLPATLDATSCAARSLFGNSNVLTDVSQGLTYNQDNPQTILNDVRLAASLGAKGFAVNWRGDGTANQTTASGQYNQRLQYMFDAVHAVNAAGTPFKLQLNYQGSANILTVPTIANDINYFMAHYGHDPALDHTYSSKPEVVFAGTWKYNDAVLGSISAAIRPKVYFIGDEKPTTWNAARAASLDGAHYYWSSQDPYLNAASFGQLSKLETMVHSTKNPDGSNKTWLAPFTPGYNAQLLYKTPTCVARNAGRTMHVIFDGNLASHPDGWTFISWNEISEGSYIVPLTRYGTLYTDTLRNVISNNR